MKKLVFILLAVGLPLGVATLANPAGLRLVGWPAMTTLALGAFGIQWLAFIPARLFQTEHFYDLTGSLTYLTVTLVALITADDRDLRTVLFAVLIVVWAGRLGSFLFRRVRRDGGEAGVQQHLAEVVRVPDARAKKPSVMRPARSRSTKNFCASAPIISTTPITYATVAAARTAGGCSTRPTTMITGATQ